MSDDWYQHPAFYEAIFHRSETAAELAFLEAVNARHGTGGKVWLEPACGSGRLVAAAARKGYRILGYDAEPAMLAYARRRLRGPARTRATFREGRMERFALPPWHGKVDLAFNLVSTFRYLSSEEAARAHLEGTRRFLKKHGLYVLGFHQTDYSRSTFEHERWVGRARGSTVICNTREWPPDRRERRSRMRNRLAIQGRNGKQHPIETCWYFRTYSPQEADRLVRSSGLRCLASYTFDYDLSERWPGVHERLDRVMVLTPGGSD